MLAAGLAGLGDLGVWPRLNLGKVSHNASVTVRGGTSGPEQLSAHEQRSNDRSLHGGSASNALTD